MVSFFSIAIILTALVVIAMIVLMVLLGVWTYRDAVSKGMNGVLWTAVVLLVPGFIGLIIYLIVRMESGKVTCSNCNAEVNGKNRYCSNCGQALVPVVEISLEKEAMRNSQKKILIGIFSTLAGIVVMVIFIVAFLIIGGIRTAGHIVNGLMKEDTWNVLEDTFGDLDALFDEDEVHVSIDGNNVRIQGKDGKDLISVNEDGDSVYINLDMKELRSILDKYGIKYDEDLSEEELERMLRERLQEVWETEEEE